MRKSCKRKTCAGRFFLLAMFLTYTGLALFSYGCVAESESTASTASAGPAISAGPTASTKSEKEDPTEEFSTFLEYRQNAPNSIHSKRMESDDGFTYGLSNGVLTVRDQDGTLCWQSDAQWWVEDFCLGDVDDDGSQDFVFTLWKSWSYYGDPPYGQTDSAEVRCHLFLYSMRTLQGVPTAKPLWCSSNLPRPILAIEFDEAGEQTPVSSGMLLYTSEGAYADPPQFVSDEPPSSFCYTWQGWGFVETEP